MESELRFAFPEKGDIEKMRNLCSGTVEGTELFTFLSLNSSVPDGSVWCGYDGKSIASIIFNDGDRNILSYGTAPPPFMPIDKSRVLLYGGTKQSSRAQFLSEGRLKEVYALLSGSDALSFDNAARYVNLLRRVSSGSAVQCGIYDGGRLVSCACIAAVNEKYALIADVFTSPGHRHRGLARECINALTAFALDCGKLPYIKCGEQLCGYYEKAGFVKYEKM